MNATPHIIESALLLLAAFLIGCLVGHVLRRIFDSRAPRRETPALAAAAPAADPPPVAAPRDLKSIRGIGPSMEAKLHAAGIHSISQIAAWDAEAVARMDAALSARGRIAREDWVGQARTLTQGG